MSRVIHLEMHADDHARARDFSGPVFGWGFVDWSEFAGMAYFGATTGELAPVLEPPAEDGAREVAGAGRVVSVVLEVDDATHGDSFDNGWLA